MHSGLMPHSRQAQGSIAFFIQNLVAVSLLLVYVACRITYSTSMEAGGKLLRPWMLGFRTDFGLPGFSDPFDMVGLLEMVLSQGFFATYFM